jgi:hypothetical protein
VNRDLIAIAASEPAYLHDGEENPDFMRMDVLEGAPRMSSSGILQ